MELRDLAVADHATILGMNNAAVPAVSELASDSLIDLAGWSRDVIVAIDQDAIVGFMFGLEPGTPYGSSNYAWFSDRFDRFGYVDRIAVDPAAHSRGVGRAIYDEFVDRCRADGLPRVCAEVNLVPRNDQSLRFHERYGFVPVGEQDLADGKRVVMLELPL